MRLGGRKDKDRDLRKYGQGRGQEIDPSVLDPKRLTKELKLEWQQKEEMEQIFNPDYTTKEKGTGLGLAAAAKIVRGHGGELAADSEPGKGSTFYVRLPRAE